MESHAAAREDRWTNIDQRRPRDLDSRIKEVFDGREHLNAVAEPLSHIAIELEKRVERELIQVVIELAAGSSSLRGKRPAAGNRVACLQSELVARNLGKLQAHECRVGGETCDYGIDELIAGNHVETLEPPSGIRLYAA